MLSGNQGPGRNGATTHDAFCKVLVIDLCEQYRPLTVAVTGSRGYLGAELVKRLQEFGARVLEISRQPLAQNRGTTTICADLSQESGWEEIVPFADVVFHLAGNTSVRTAEENSSSSLTSSVLPIIRLIDSARRHARKPRVVLASTATVYGLTSFLPVSEQMTPSPLTNYDLHKWFAEQQLLLAVREGVLAGSCLRLSNVYGPSTASSTSKDRGVINRIASMALNGEPIQTFGGGNCRRDYIYISDVIDAFCYAGVAEGISGRVFNIGSGKGMLIADAHRCIAKLVTDQTGRPVNIVQTPNPTHTHPIENRDFVADISSFKELTTWFPRIDFQTGITLLLKHLSHSSI